MPFATDVNGALIVAKGAAPTVTTLVSGATATSATYTPIEVTGISKLTFWASFGVSANHAEIEHSVDGVTWFNLISAASALSGAINYVSAFAGFIRPNVKTWSSDSVTVKVNQFAL